MPAHRPALWDIFCTVIDNHGDLGVCWRLARQLREAGQMVRLWVDDASALSWMAPAAARGEATGIQVWPWEQATRNADLLNLPRADVWIEAFGCHLPEAFVAHGVVLTGSATPPVWINLEYLSAEDWVPRLHGLPSPVMNGPAKGWTKHFFYPGFTPDTGGLLREANLLQRRQAFDRIAWRTHLVPNLVAGARWISLFCYEPAALPQLLQTLVHTPHQLLVLPGRPLAALQRALQEWPTQQPRPNSLLLPYTDQDGFDQMLWACDLNCVRGEDSLVRALWAGQPFVWHIYPQHDDAHHAKLNAFLDWLQAPASMRTFHHAWNGLSAAQAAIWPDKDTLQEWAACTQAARQRLLLQQDLLSQLLRTVTGTR